MEALKEPQAQSTDSPQPEAKHKWRLAVVDDQPGIRLLVSELFRERGWEIAAFPDGESASQAFANEHFDVVLLDLSMPGKSGIEVLKEIRERWSDTTEVIVITAYASVDSAIEALTLDAYAYITKPFEVETLITAVTNAQEKLALQRQNTELIEHLKRHEAELKKRIEEATQELAEANARLAELAIRDSVTGLYNQRFFTEKLQEEIDRALRYNGRFTLVFLDIDNFKEYNDTCGHLRGNEALAIIAKLLREGVRRHDIVARFGGEEFAIILIEASDRDVANVCERIRKATEQTRFPGRSDDESFQLTISMGYASCPSDATEVDELIDKADQAMYHAKRLGKNRVCAYRDIADEGRQPQAPPEQ